MTALIGLVLLGGYVLTKFLNLASGVLALSTDQIGSPQPASAPLLKRFRPSCVRRTTFDHWPRHVVGLTADLKRKSIKPIAVVGGVPVRMLQEFLAFFVWNEGRVGDGLQQWVVDEHDCGVKGISLGHRLFARNFSSAVGRGDSKVIALPVTGCSKPSDLACSAIRLRIHRGCIACLVL